MGTDLRDFHLPLDSEHLFQNRGGRRMPELFSLIDVGSEKKHIKTKTRKQNFHGIVPGFWGGIIFMCFFSPILNDPEKKHINIFWHPPSPGTILQICLCLCVFFP